MNDTQTIRAVVFASVAACGLVMACSSSTSTTPTNTATSKAAAVAGAADTHCAGKPAVVVDPAVCHVAPDAGDQADAGDADGGAADQPDYGPTSFNSEADDDDCKYHVAWESTAVAENSDVTFKIVATNKSGGTPVGGANPSAEVFLDETHPAPNTPSATVESPAGTYKIGPIRFDKPGKWTVRFHFHEECNDSEESPHGHAAFFVNVP